MNNLESSRQQYIQELKGSAARVKEFIGKYRKRRPIVIEFSGAPKSGKTSSINSLMQFLKRNDFKVKVLQESASVCPVKDKHSPMFNLWTACDSIRALVGELESDRTRYDVIMIDRGIFDSMCWFEWLLENDKIEKAMKKVMDSFLAMEELTSYIDIVFVYKATPEKSIEREYANLLTDVPGSIMNTEVLSEYLRAVDSTIKYARKKKIFRKIEIIDTSDQTQADVGKKVTETVLGILMEMLDERIGYIKVPEKIMEKFDELYCMSYEEIAGLGGLDLKPNFLQRAVLEEKKEFTQIVPIAVFQDAEKNEVLIVRKPPKATSEESVEKDRILPYVGGHVRKEDVNGKNEKNLLEICKSTLKREVREELGIAISLDNIRPDFIYVRDGSRSDLHMAVCFLIKEKKETVKVRMESEELFTNRGKSKSGTFTTPDIEDKNLNSWGKIILDRYFSGRVRQVRQMTIFDKTEI